ncbi:MAG: 23S rRNA (guanosine(2251)-2'-O)-methyltransferase RlmB [Opitutaceae bacterium]
MEKIFGKHSARAVFLARPHAVRRLILAGKEAYFKELFALAKQAGVEPELVDWGEFQRIGKFSEDEKHQGVCLFADPRPILSEKDFDLLNEARVVLMLDQVSNPQNLATILRGAVFFGVDAVVLLKNRSVDVTPTVVRYAVGGAEFVHIFRVTNLVRSIETLKSMKYWIYGLDERGEKTLAQTGFEEKAAIIVGAEGEGLRRRVRGSCDFLVRIPGGRRGVESLNAAVAASIAIAEIFRQRVAGSDPKQVGNGLGTTKMVTV